MAPISILHERARIFGSRENSGGRENSAGVRNGNAAPTAVPGALLEAKGLTVAVHSRGVRSAERRRRLRAGLLSVASGEARRQGFRVMPGAMAVDFVPRGHDKGRALRALRARMKPRAIFYFGDSDGDEPAFSALTNRDFPVRVGREATRAPYRVTGVGEVARFLEAVAANRAVTR